MTRVADASAKLHPEARIMFAVLNNDTAVAMVEAALGRHDLEWVHDQAGEYIPASVLRRAGYTHITETLLRLYQAGAIISRQETQT